MPPEKKPKKKTDKQIIRELKRNLTGAIDMISDKEQLLRESDRFIGDLKHTIFGTYSAEESNEDLKERIQSLITRNRIGIEVRGGVVNNTIVMLSEENSRLWYLLRAVMGDKTLRGESVNHTKGPQMIDPRIKDPGMDIQGICGDAPTPRSPYRKPRF